MINVQRTGVKFLKGAWSSPFDMTEYSFATGAEHFAVLQRSFALAKAGFGRLLQPSLLRTWKKQRYDGTEKQIYNLQTIENRDYRRLQENKSIIESPASRTTLP